MNSEGRSVTYVQKRPTGWIRRALVNEARNTGKVSAAWRRFEQLNIAAHEVRRALLGIDGPEAWCGRNARLRRCILACRNFELPRLP